MVDWLPVMIWPEKSEICSKIFDLYFSLYLLFRNRPFEVLKKACRPQLSFNSNFEFEKIFLIYHVYLIAFFAWWRVACQSCLCEIVSSSFELWGDSDAKAIFIDSHQVMSIDLAYLNETALNIRTKFKLHLR